MADGEALTKFATGEFRRTLDQRFRLSIPSELVDALQLNGEPNSTGLLTKERPGAISLWPLEPWRSQFAAGMQLIQQKFASGRFAERIPRLQSLGRLVSTRQREIPIAGRGRVVIPEGFREFLGAEPGSDVMVIGAAICIEIWRVDAWTDQLAEEIPLFHDLYDDLSQ